MNRKKYSKLRKMLYKARLQGYWDCDTRWRNGTHILKEAEEILLERQIDAK